MFGNGPHQTFLGRIQAANNARSSDRVSTSAMLLAKDTLGKLLPSAQVLGWALTETSFCLGETVMTKFLHVFPSVKPNAF